MGGLRRVLLLALNDLRLTLKDRAAVIWMLVLPLALMWLFGQAGGATAGPPQFSLAVADRDGGWLARALVEELGGESVALEEVDPETRPRHAGAEEGPIRVLVVPEGFTAGVLVGEQQTVRLELSHVSSASFGTAAKVHVLKAIGRVLVRLVEMELDGDLAGGAEVVAGRYAELAGGEPSVNLVVETAGEGTPVPSGYAQSVPGMLTMIVLMMTLIYGSIFLAQERAQGMLARQASLPVRRREIYLGKLIGRLLVAGAQAAVLLAGGRYLYGLELGRSPVGLVLLVGSFAFAVAGLATLLGLMLTTAEQAEAVSWILALVMAGLGGCWWPAEVMPEWLRTAVHILPTAWAMDGFHALISFGRGLEGVLLPTAALLGFGVVFSVAGARLLRFE